jgi:hypothetical protein
MKVISLRISNFAGILEADIKPGKVDEIWGIYAEAEAVISKAEGKK